MIGVDVGRLSSAMSAEECLGVPLAQVQLNHFWDLLTEAQRRAIVAANPPIASWDYSRGVETTIAPVQRFALHVQRFEGRCDWAAEEDAPEAGPYPAPEAWGRFTQEEIERAAEVVRGAVGSSIEVTP